MDGVDGSNGLERGSVHGKEQIFTASRRQNLAETLQFRPFQQDVWIFDFCCETANLSRGMVRNSSVLCSTGSASVLGGYRCWYVQRQSYVGSWRSLPAAVQVSRTPVEPSPIISGQANTGGDRYAGVLRRP